MTTLREELKNYQGQLVKVGMVSGYVYIHTVDANTEKDINRINDAYITQYKKKLKTYASKIDKAEKHVRKMVFMANDAKSRNFYVYFDGKPDRKKCTDQIDLYKRYTGLSETDVEEIIASRQSRYRRRKKRLEEHLRESSRFLDREVVNSYPSMNYTDGAQIILIDGIEEGAYWFAAEYKEADDAGKIVYKIVNKGDEDD